MVTRYKLVSPSQSNVSESKREPWWGTDATSTLSSLLWPSLVRLASTDPAPSSRRVRASPAGRVSAESQCAVTQQQRCPGEGESLPRSQLRIRQDLQSP